jgi:Fur family zinc uptake transcriptional regulator
MAKKNDIKQLVEHSRKKFERKGMRLTEKRADVLAILIAAGRPLSAYEVLDQYNAAHDSAMPAMSAYRILDCLISADLVHKLESQSKYLPCSHIRCAHQHAPPQFLVCQECGRASEVEVAQSVLHALKKCAADIGFKLASTHLELNCICDSCQHP